MSDNKQIVLKDPGSPGDGKPPKQKPKKVALEEEQFTEAMKKIIRRDYFPDVLKWEAQLAYIEATENNDPVKLREISARYATDLVQTPSAQTPSSWLNEKRNVSHDDTMAGDDDESVDRPPARKIPKPEDSKSLDAFLHKYHSEDDAAFGEIMEREEAKRREKYAWMYEREALAESMNRPAITSGKEDIQRLEGRDEPQLAITDGESSSTETGSNKHGEIKMWKYTAKNSLMYVPDGVEFSSAELVKQGKGREIKQGNTRLSRDFLNKMAAAGTPADEADDMAQVRQKQLQKEKIGIDGKQLGAVDSPRVHGYGFVATPQINPGVDASPLMTWGTIDSTPLHIDSDVGASTPGQVFKIPKESVRDNIGLKLASKASKSQREKKKVAMAQATSTILGGSPSIRSPLIGSTTDRLQMLSPAARKLIRQSTTPGTLKGDRSLRASYSNTPMRSPISTPGGTPKLYGKDGASTPSLTDNLLKLK